MLSTQGAVWRYWRDILYAWAGAMTLDFAPLFCIVLLSIAHDRQQEEQGGATGEDFLRIVTPRGKTVAVLSGGNIEWSGIAPLLGAG